MQIFPIGQNSDLGLQENIFYSISYSCPDGLRHCHRLLAVSHHCPGLNSTWACDEVASDLGLGGVFCWVFGFP